MSSSAGSCVRIDVFIPAIRKALELLIETRGKIDDQRQRIALDAPSLDPALQPPRGRSTSV